MPDPLTKRLPQLDEAADLLGLMRFLIQNGDAPAQSTTLTALTQWLYAGGDFGAALAARDEAVAAAAGFEAVVGRAAQYGYTDLVSARHFTAESIELDFAAPAYRTAFDVAATIGEMPGWVYTGDAGSFENGDGEVEYFAADEPRINDRGFLKERVTSNLVKKSAAFDADPSIWEKFAGGTGSVPVVTPNAALAPDGTMTADLITFDLNGGNTGGDYSLCMQNAIPVDDGVEHATSYHFQSDTPCSLVLQGVAGAGYQLVEVTAEWSRPYVAQAAVGASGFAIFGIVGGQGASDVAAVRCWGCQVNPGPHPTAYIGTDETPVTRAADTAEAFGIGTSGTLVMEFEVPPIDGEDDYLAHIPDHLMLYVTSGVVSSSAPGGILSAPGAPLVAGDIARAAVTWAPGARAISVNGGIPAEDDNGFPTSAAVWIGGIGKEFGSPIRKVLRLNEAVSHKRLRAMAGGEPAVPGSLPRWTRVVESSGIGGRDSAWTFQMGGRQYFANGFIVGGGARHDIHVTEDSRTFNEVNDDPDYETWSHVAAVGLVMYAWKTVTKKSLDGGATWNPIAGGAPPFHQVFEAPHIVTPQGTIIAYHDGTEFGAAGFYEFDPAVEIWAFILASPFGRQVTNLEMVVKDGSVFLIGGVDRETPNVPPEVGYPGWTTLNWVWRSDDWCRSAVMILADMPMQPRVWATTAVFEGEIRRMGGYNNLVGNETNFDDDFRSPDGLAWFRVEVWESFPPRHAANAWLQNGRLQLGMGKGATTLDDVWEFQR